jgi:hypothetical protein
MRTRHSDFFTGHIMLQIEQSATLPGQMAALFRPLRCEIAFYKGTSIAKSPDSGYSSIDSTLRPGGMT